MTRDATRGGGALGRLGAALALCAACALVLSAPALGAPSPPLPGGAYVGETARGAFVKVRVAANATESTLRGTVVHRCSRTRARFRTDDGRFVATKRNRKGRVLLRARGRFRAMGRVVGWVGVRPSLRHGRHCRNGRFGAGLANAAPIERRTIRYGPFTTEPNAGHHGDGGHNVPLGNLEKPCTDCYLVGMLPNLVNPDGSTANFDTGAMLHHVVFFNRGERDATCSGWPQRFFASGNERVPFVLPRGYGYRVDGGDDWVLLTHLMNMGHAPKDLGIEVTFFYVDGSAPMEGTTPFWFDIDNCGNSEYTTPAGRHTEAREFVVPAALAGEVVAAGGHLHDHGERIRLENLDRDQVICGGGAVYGNDPSYMGHIESVGGCTGRPLARLAAGETVRLLSRYDAPATLDDVMGIVVGYVAPG